MRVFGLKRNILKSLIMNSVFAVEGIIFGFSYLNSFETNYSLTFTKVIFRLANRLF